MSEPFVGEIRLVGFNFAPLGWAACDGALLPISQNTALFSLLGTTYGGDGKTTFGLPDLRGRLPLQAGQGPGLSPRALGERGGAETVGLQPGQLPRHRHALNSTASPTAHTPANTRVLSAVDGGGPAYHVPRPGSQVQMDAAGLLPAGGNAAHNNLPPYRTLMFVIALQGIYPPRP